MKTEVYLPIYTQYKYFSKGLSSHLRKPHDNNLRKRVVDAHKGWDGYAKLWHCFQVSSTGVRSIIKKLKESHGVQNKPIRGMKRKSSKTLKRKLVFNDVFRLQNNCQDVSEWLNQVWNCSLNEENHLKSAQEWTARVQIKINSAFAEETFLRQTKERETWNTLEAHSSSV